MSFDFSKFQQDPIFKEIGKTYFLIAKTEEAIINSAFPPKVNSKEGRFVEEFSLDELQRFMVAGGQITNPLNFRTLFGYTDTDMVY